LLEAKGEIDLSNNNINSLDGFEQLGIDPLKVVSLTLSHNKLTNSALALILKRKWNRLETITLIDNEITHVGKSSLTKVRKLFDNHRLTIYLFENNLDKHSIKVLQSEQSP